MVVSKGMYKADYFEPIKTSSLRWEGDSSPAIVTVLPITPPSFQSTHPSLLTANTCYFLLEGVSPTDCMNLFGPCTDQGGSSRVNAPKAALN